jgi:endonuclease/exonuclease/phosphatase family metal-dependent hydrolase
MSVNDGARHISQSPSRAKPDRMLDRSQTLPHSLASALRRKAPGFIDFESDTACTTIASYNVHKCVGTDGKFDPARIARVLGELDADIVALQEADERTGARLGLLDLNALQRDTDLVPTHTPEHHGSHGWHGNLILARRGIVQGVHQVRLPGFEPRGAIIVDLELKGVALRVVAAHFGLLRRSRSQQASALVEATQSVLRPTILLGDLNEWRVRNRSSLLALLPHFGPVHAVLPSFPSRFPLFALDRILARPATLITRIEVHQSPLARLASDHLPVKARLNLGSIRQAATQPDRA